MLVIVLCATPDESYWKWGKVSSRKETYDKPVFNTSIAIKETVPIEGSKI